MAYTFDQYAGGLNAPSHHHTQYFEMASVYGLYSDGWMLSADPKRAPWQLTQAAIPNPASAYQVELFDLNKDWTQYADLSAQYPEKVQEMRDMMFGEFARYQVLPLDASAATRFVTPRPSLSAGRTVFNYSGITTTDIPVGNMPSLLNSSYTITADIEVTGKDAHGMIINEGGRYWGWALYLVKGKPIFTYNFLGLKMTKWLGPALSPGKHTIEFDFKYDGLGAGTLAYNNVSGIGKGGTGTLTVDGKVVSTQKMEQTLPLTKHMDAVFNIGDASGTPVDDKDYQVPFKFTGKINHLIITVDRPKLSEEDIQKIQEADRKSKLNN